MALAIALGNTNLRYLLTRGDAIVDRGVQPVEQGAPAELLDALDGTDDVAIASVNEVRLAAVEDAVKTRSKSCVVLGRDLPVPIENGYRDPARVGIDRLLGVLAASARFPGEGVVVVDFGTAVTVNVGGPEGAFLGGYIGIGGSTAARALAEHAPRLPRVNPAEAVDQRELPEGLPRDTETAIARGIALEVAGGVESILRSLRERLPWSVRIIGTGGDAARLAPGVPSIEEVDDDLVLRGVLRAFELAGGR